MSLKLNRVIVKPASEWRITAREAERIQPDVMDALWQRCFAWFFLLSGYAYYFGVARLSTDAEGYLFSHIKAFVLIGLSQWVLVYLYGRSSNHVEFGPGLRRLRTRVPTEDACPVSVTVRQRGVVTGRDEGYLWIEEGTLFFKGLQTVFRINREDVPPLGLWPRRARPNPGVGRDVRWIPVPVGDRQMALELRMLDPFEDHDARRRAHRMQRGLYSWLTHRPEGSLESLLPPMVVHPSLAMPTPFRREGVAAGVALSCANLGLLFTSDPDFRVASTPAFVSVVAAGLSLVLLYGSIRLAFSQWHDQRVRRAIDAAQPADEAD